MILHESGRGHVTGESLFVDDIAPMKNELQVSYVGSPMACGILKKVDASEALKIPGVVAIYTEYGGHTLGRLRHTNIQHGHSSRFAFGRIGLNLVFRCFGNLKVNSSLSAINGNRCPI